MCQACDLIDYPVADCWRPCYVPSQRAKPKGYIPTTPRGGFSEDDVAPLQAVQRLSMIIRQQKAEIAGLKAQQSQKAAPAFDGPEAS